MSQQTILEKFKNRCPNCNHNEVIKIISEVYCGYCEHKWQTIYDYQTDCEAKAGEWVLEDKIDILEDKIKRAKDLMKKVPEAEGIFDGDGNSEGFAVCKGLQYDYHKISDFMTKMKMILDS
jgi:hypothetical protein